MILEDVIVGTVSTIIGAIGIAAGIGNWDACYELTKTRWLVSRVGRTRARVVFIVAGLLFVVLGIAIGLGTRLTSAE